MNIMSLRGKWVKLLEIHFSYKSNIFHVYPAFIFHLVTASLNILTLVVFAHLKLIMKCTHWAKQAINQSRCVSRWVPEQVSGAQRPDGSNSTPASAGKPSPRLSPRGCHCQRMCQPALLQLISQCWNVLTLQRRSCLTSASEKAAGGLLSCFLGW